jgi:hypothetical protein
MAVTVTSTEEAWFASNIGLVRAERSAVSSAGSVTFTPYTLAITGGTVNGLPLFTAPPDGTVTNVLLAHSALVYDSVHDRYYASIPGSVAVNGNSIATIDPQTGAVTYSAPVGSDPGPLAVSADGSVLHVGLKGAGSVVKLSLPSMTVLGAVALPVANFFGQLYAESLTVSPVDPTVLAVSTYRAGVSPRHGGVALIRDMVLQPVMTQDHTGSNLVAFGVAGTEVFGLNTETTEFGLRRISVLANGLAEQQVVPNAISTFGLQTLEAVGASVVVGQRVYRASDLALLGTVAADGGGCRALPSGTRVVCLSGGFGAAELRLAVADLATFVVQSRPLVKAGPLNLVNFQLVPGPSGQVAIRDNAGFFDAPSTRIFLFTSALLQ